jgi:hypothetical protein
MSMKRYGDNCRNKTGISESEPSFPGEGTLKNYKNKTGLCSTGFLILLVLE